MFDLAQCAKMASKSTAPPAYFEVFLRPLPRILLHSTEKNQNYWGYQR